MDSNARRAPAGGPDPRVLYRQQQLSHAGRERLLLLTLETALRACQAGRRGLLRGALEELISGIDLESGEIATQFLRLYEYLVYLDREGRMEEVESILRELLETWETALGPSGPDSPAEVKNG